MSATTPVYAIPYAQSTDTLPDYPALDQDQAEAVEAALLRKVPTAPTQRVLTADGNFALDDATYGKTVIANKATAIAFTILPQGSGAGQLVWTTEQELHFANRNDGILTITPGAGVTFIGDTLTFGKGKGGKAVRTASNEWLILPFSAGSAITPAVVGSTTGSPTTGTFTYGGETYNFTKWTANGSCTFSTAGRIKVLVVGGGGGSGSRGGGGGGGYVETDIDVIAGAYPVNVGAGGTGAADTSTAGGGSTFGAIVTQGGGGGGGTIRGGTNGASGGGGGDGYAAGTALTNYGPQGFAGNPSSVAGGGGGAAAVGVNGGAGGAGKTWANGTTYAAGGATSPLATPTANSGNGANAYNTNGGAGVVIIAIKA